MRMLQIVGLTAKAKAWIENNCVKEDYDECPHCGKSTKKRVKSREYGFEEQFYTDGVYLHEYETLGGEVVREVVQAVPWSSGPVVFLCLEKEGARILGKEWSEGEMEERTGIQ